MPEVVQAKCPQCQNVLRIPAAWLGQAVRCKHCQSTFQARSKSKFAGAPGKQAPPATVAARQPAPGAAVAAGKPAPGIPVGLPVTTGSAPVGPTNAFDFNSAKPSEPSPRRPGRRSGWAGWLIGSGILAVVAILLVVFGQQILDAIDRSISKTVQDLNNLQASDSGKKTEKANNKKTESAGGTDNKGTIDPPKSTGKETGKPSVEPPPPPLPPKKTEKEPVAVQPPKKTDPGTKPEPGIGKNPPKVAKEVLFPRRALAISVNDYLLANSLNYGSPRLNRFPGSSTAAVLKEFGNFHLKFPNTQLFELSDQSLTAHAPLLPVIKTTIEDFLNTSRAQDRIVVLFAGHAVEDDKEAYLVPLEGDLKDTKTLLPLNWVYDRLKSCKAREKLLILDVCRFDPARGSERPGGGPMGEVLDKALQNPPAGVQVWSSCIKEQQSFEFESGSIFLQALCAAMQEKLPRFTEPEHSLPLDVLVPRVNKYIEGLLAKQKLKQVTRLTGSEMMGGAPFNPDEPLAPLVVIKPPPVEGGAAGTAVVQKVIDEINKAPPPRVNRNNSAEVLRLNALPPFSATVLEEYRADYNDEMEFLNKEKEFPLRAAVVKAKKVLKENATKFAMREVFTGSATAAVKKVIEAEQQAPAKAVFFIEQALEDLKKVGEERDKEPSKRWQAHYDYVMARVKARLIYLTEYNYVLAQIRTDSLPNLEDGFSGYRVGSREKISVPEAPIKKMAKELQKDWERIANSYPGTPWALLARREQMTVLGLEWRPSRD